MKYAIPWYSYRPTDDTTEPPGHILQHLLPSTALNMPDKEREYAESRHWIGQT